MLLQVEQTLFTASVRRERGEAASTKAEVARNVLASTFRSDIRSCATFYFALNGQRETRGYS